jgi:hypothetical protein
VQLGLLGDQSQAQPEPECEAVEPGRTARTLGAFLLRDCRSRRRRWQISTPSRELTADSCTRLASPCLTFVGDSRLSTASRNRRPIRVGSAPRARVYQRDIQIRVDSIASCAARSSRSVRSTGAWSSEDGQLPLREALQRGQGGLDARLGAKDIAEHLFALLVGMSRVASTSRLVRIAVNGVRSSWDATAAKSAPIPARPWCAAARHRCGPACPPRPHDLGGLPTRGPAPPPAWTGR